MAEPTDTALREAYATVVEGGRAFWRQAPAGCVRVSGPDRVDFLHRQTTNDVKRLGQGNVLPNVLTAPTGRILAAFTMLAEPEAIALIAPLGVTAWLADYLRRRIFFMDHVAVDDASAELAQFDLGGAAAGGLLQSLGIDAAPEGELLAQGEGLRAFAIAAGAPLNPLYRIVAPAEAAAEVTARLAAGEGVVLPDGAFEVLRIEAGLPAAGHELTDAYTPLEVGLRGWVASDKGCYTGQEVIARQITYDKVTKSLVGLRLASMVEPGATLTGDGRRCGEVTSVAESPRYGPIALAVVRRPADTPGTSLTAGEGESTVRGVVTALPFG